VLFLIFLLLFSLPSLFYPSTSVYLSISLPHSNSLSLHFVFLIHSIFFIFFHSFLYLLVLHSPFCLFYIAMFCLSFSSLLSVSFLLIFSFLSLQYISSFFHFFFHFTLSYYHFLILLPLCDTVSVINSCLVLTLINLFPRSQFLRYFWRSTLRSYPTYRMPLRTQYRTAPHRTVAHPCDWVTDKEAVTNAQKGLKTLFSYWNRHDICNLISHGNIFKMRLFHVTTLCTTKRIL
jgi:hypothetical protein